MLDLFTVFTKGGVVLWSHSYAENIKPAFALNPVDSLIRDVLVEERAGLDSYEKDSYRVHWTFANDLNLIFVVVYQKILQLAYIDELLALVRTAFCELYSGLVKDDSTIHDYPFTDTFETILSDLEAAAALEKKNKAPRKFQDSKKFANTLEGSKTIKDAPAPAAKAISKAEAGAPSSKVDIASIIKKKKTGNKDIAPVEEKKKGKAQRTWGEGGIPLEGNKKLDYGDEPAASLGDDDAAIANLVDRSNMGKKNSEGLYEAPEMDDFPEADAEDHGSQPNTAIKSKAAVTGGGGGFFAFLKSIASGQTTLTSQNLDPIMAKMKEQLIAKNVASDIADNLCASVSSSLVGQKQSTFTSITSTVKASMETALRRILTPRTSTDVLRDVLNARKEGRPYTFVFVGVNGVGKSTNLSKVCFWLLQNNLKVLIAACDTFRSGAVEQLRVHARNLKALGGGAVVELYEKGYGKDAAGIAKDAINYAKQNAFDVVLVDTAGRMQDNEPLMRALAKLVATNSPDKVIFVGEALVGNEAVDQLSKFNEALRDFSGMAVPRQIDGIILSKFDTVDDKVGAALSMTFITGQPILFVGTGQTYTDLKRMNVKSIVTSLLR